MRQTQLLSPTLRQAPADAEAASHQMLVRAGYIRPLASGVYSYLPLGWRVMRQLEHIIREEMERAGAQELHLPALLPAELWKQSGRYSVYGPELIRLQDRHGREFALGPTHEEAITALIRDEVKSYKRMPLTVYQIQTKYRDERRPRFGLLRGREFLMKDAYSFDIDAEGLDASYRAMFSAYHRIMRRLGLRYRAIEADAGAIGGDGATHEFTVLADVGEDTVVSCTACDYAANLERAESGGAARNGADSEQGAGQDGNRPAPVRFPTPGMRTIEELASGLKLDPSALIKTLIYTADGAPIAVLVRGDHEVNEVKVKNCLGADAVELADEETVSAVTGAPTGFAGPIGLRADVRLLVDRDAAAMSEGIAGGNAADVHVKHVVPGRDIPLDMVGDYRNVIEGEACPHCGEGQLQFHRGIEAGHVFKLGTKYSAALGATVLDPNGREQPLLMGCYGIGVSRLLAAIVEQHHDERGIIWPLAIAPFQVHLIPVAWKDAAQRQAAERLYEQLQQAGLSVLLDDRDERIGVKLADADLLGTPLRIVIGRSIAEGMVEWKERASAEAETVPVGQCADKVQDWAERPDSSHEQIVER
ncbi:proline--tRNA ligase [Paenibacillus thiaminolyticus]|uniref:Proline--tRNA ligase n=1 Tax=Paenibacillus thiaminolyticus TaxID=49283 RepID=A0AAP9DRD8_PANTH|nr:proline--tRNA ligase [Paenibacillus thiaminolyticus]MCY9538015.1 proline--tRNA ligase [Paenibacillus thiaminolyticus]MCY9604919.1 proline--tRNA ligase [Paenibacillus thiaminolyticus]MCY9610654.1 proline--tRNA ligase [Paenibacillus thiaminolyticus]MCY9615982.1 proline--tRNA ligase [Paenibacillus thiaminolyticus]MCY9622388.1 proline--tRNA ligase [Paenibacillus thiaminolyticus]